MPKLKTHSGAKKRFKLKGNGKAKCRKPFRNRILTKKTNKWERQQRGQREVHSSDALSVERMLKGC